LTIPIGRRFRRSEALADVVASYGITLRRERAGTYRALCPFHQERTPSFWIDARDSFAEHYFCFGCTSHGDVITFVMEREGCSFQEACERLSTRSRPPVLGGYGRQCGRPHDAPTQSARPPAAEFDCDEVWIGTCEELLSVFFIPTGNTPHVFQTRVNQQDEVLVVMLAATLDGASIACWI
jgi:hypothetical protein